MLPTQDHTPDATADRVPRGQAAVLAQITAGLTRPTSTDEVFGQVVTAVAEQLGSVNTGSTSQQYYFLLHRSARWSRTSAVSGRYAATVVGAANPLLWAGQFGKGSTMRVQRQRFIDWRKLGSQGDDGNSREDRWLWNAGFSEPFIWTPHHQAIVKKRLSLLFTRLIAPILAIIICGATAHADIFQWQYIEPANPGFGIEASTTLCPDGAGASAVPGAMLQNRDLTQAYLGGVNLTGASLVNSNLSNAVFPYNPILTNSDWTGAIIANVNFGASTGFTLSQLYSTGSYKAGDLHGITFGLSLAGANFSGQDLRNVGLGNNTLANGNLTGANLTNARFDRLNLSHVTGLTPSQIYSTSNYQSRNMQNVAFAGDDLSGINFSRQFLLNVDFTQANLSGADLTNANLVQGVLTSANLTGANIAGAYFGRATGLTLQQLYSTASYQSGNLKGIGLQAEDLTGANFAGQNLTGANLSFGNGGGGAANLTNASLHTADLTGANLAGATLTNADFTNAVVVGTDLGYAVGLTFQQLYDTAGYQAKDLHTIRLEGNNLTAIELSGQNLSGAYLYSANFTNANLSGTNLTGASAYSANLTNAKLSSANLTGASLSRSTLTGADLTNAIVTGADFSSATGFTLQQLYTTASYASKDLHGIGLAGINLSNADFTRTNLTGANVSYSTLTNANFTGATVASALFGGGTGFTFAQLYSTASYQTRALAGITLVGNFTAINLAQQNLTGANFSNTTLDNANLSHSILQNAVFFIGNSNTSCSLIGADLSNADLTNARLFRANLTNANLTNANLTNADLRRAVGASLSGAILTNTILPDSTINGLHLTAAGPRMVLVGNIRHRGTFEEGIDIKNSMVLEAGSILQYNLSYDQLELNWDYSTLTFDPGIPISVDGATLDIEFPTSADRAQAFKGERFRLFVWDGVTPVGQFAFVGGNLPSGDAWDTTNLYATGYVSIIAAPIPEPTGAALLSFSVLALLCRGKRRRDDSASRLTLFNQPASGIDGIKRDSSHFSMDHS